VRYDERSAGLACEQVIGTMGGMQNPVSKIVRRAAAQLQRRIQSVQALLSQPHDSEDAYQQASTALDDCLAELSTTGLWGTDNRLPSSELWNAAGELLCRGWLQNQARIKPRGYAGDYEMLARIYEQRLCDDPLGRLFDRYFQAQAAPQAVRNRMRMMADWIVQAVRGRGPERPTKLAIVGSALGLEVRDALRSLDEHQRRQLTVTLLDMDPVALEFARARLEPLLPASQLVAVPTNVFRLAERPRLAKPLANADLVLCPGLFDYLDDSQATAMLRILWQRLAPGGRMTVFQFAPRNPTRAYMEWLGNWYLIYREADDLDRLAQAAAIPAKAVEVGAEPLGICLYLAASRS
jgi:hypothetical protein